MTEKSYRDDEFIDKGFYHLRVKSGFEVIGNLVYGEAQYDEDGNQKREPFILSPVRVSVDVSDRGLAIKLLPYSVFSNDDVFFFDSADVEFLVEMTEQSIGSYYNFLNQYKSSLENNSSDDEAVEESVEKRVLH